MSDDKIKYKQFLEIYFREMKFYKKISRDKLSRKSHNETKFKRIKNFENLKILLSVINLDFLCI